jgi:hypothetical protein
MSPVLFRTGINLNVPFNLKMLVYYFNETKVKKVVANARTKSIRRLSFKYISLNVC